MESAAALLFLSALCVTAWAVYFTVEGWFRWPK